MFCFISYYSIIVCCFAKTINSIVYCKHYEYKRKGLWHVYMHGKPLKDKNGKAILYNYNAQPGTKGFDYKLNLKKKKKEMKNFIKGVFLFIVMALISGCGSRAGGSSDNLHKREPMTKVRIYAREVLVEKLDDPMFPCAYYSSGKPFYGKDKEYYKLSDREIRMIKVIIGDKQKWQKSGSKCPFLDIKEYFRQYLAYRKDGKTYVLVNLYKYFYIVLPYKPNISLIHSILYYKLFAYICKFLYLYNIILADIYA